MENIIDRLDKIANSLQDAGLIHLAGLLDQVANTVDSGAKYDTHGLSDEYAYRYELFNDYLTNLSNTKLGQDLGLPRPLRELRMYVAKGGVKKLVDVEQSTEWKKFKKLVSNDPEFLIPGEYFHNGTNQRNAKLSVLADLIRVLELDAADDAKDETFSQARTDAWRQSIRKSEKWQKADSLFGKPKDSAMARTAYYSYPGITDTKTIFVLDVINNLERVRGR